MSWPVSNLVLRFDQSLAYRRFLIVLLGFCLWMLACSACLFPLKLLGMLTLLYYGALQIRAAMPSGRVLNLMHQSEQWFYAYEEQIAWTEVEVSLFIYNRFFLF